MKIHSVLSITLSTLVMATATQAATYHVDFQHDAGSSATGYVIASSGAGILSQFSNPGPYSLGDGYSLSFTGTYTTFSGDQAANPVDEDGWELVDPLGTFTLSGLSAGDTVTMYATNAWDDFGVLNSVVSQISFGGGSLVDVLAGNFPGTNGTFDTDPANTNDMFGDSLDTGFFTIIASDVLVTGSSLSGDIDKSASNGQFGAFVFDITPAVPEPSAYALIGGIMALCAVMVRRRR